MPECQAQSKGADDKREREPHSGFVGKHEIGENACGEQDRHPEDPAVVLRFEETRRGAQDRGQQPVAASRAAGLVAVPPVFLRDPHGRCSEPAEAASSLPLPRIHPYATSRPPLPLVLHEGHAPGRS
jgi:hypothetical protein